MKNTSQRILPATSHRLFVKKTSKWLTEKASVFSSSLCQFFLPLFLSKRASDVSWGKVLTVAVALLWFASFSPLDGREEKKNERFYLWKRDVWKTRRGEREEKEEKYTRCELRTTWLRREKIHTLSLPSSSPLRIAWRNRREDCMPRRDRFWLWM